ncbi:unnamed protein product [Linum tenue]|uniref:Uncharacterized protein n=1 Tax=Linum tenue TaxID=586396 RepID=A0AAV0KF24_9ROSI|nr:unnamed protein product [Linum tenue]
MDLLEMMNMSNIWRKHFLPLKLVLQVLLKCIDQNRKKKKVRGITRGLETVKLAAAMGKEKFPITIDVSQGRPVNGVQSAKLSSEFGLISREYMDEIPIRRTKDFKKNHLRPDYDRLNMHLQVEDISEEAVQDSIDGLLQIQLKQQRSKLKKIFLECRDAVEARTMKPPGISQKNWDDLIDYWLSDKAKKEANNGEECDRISLYKMTYYYDTEGWRNECVEANYNRMQELLTEGNMTMDEICDTVLGVKPGYVSGLGHGPKPVTTSSNKKIRSLEEALKQNEAEKNGWKSECQNLRAEVGTLREEVSEIGGLKEEIARLKGLLSQILQKF